MAAKSHDTLIFIATYNEVGNVESMCGRILVLSLNADLLFLDDNSPDGTGEILDRLALKHSNISVIHRPRKLGLGDAHLEGIAWAYEHKYETLVTMDCDFLYSPDDISVLLECPAGADVTVASRFIKDGSLEDWTLGCAVLSRAGHFLTRRLLAMPWDATGAFRVYRLSRIPREVFGLVRARGYAFFFESLFILNENKFHIAEVPVVLARRRHGKSKMSLREALRSALRVVSLCLTARFHRERLRLTIPVGVQAGGGKAVNRFQMLFALILTAFAVGLHITLARHAGGLWRDEVSLINLAAMPALADVWKLNQFDSFPILWHLVVRGWTAVNGAANDTGLRVLGLLVGLGILGSLWLNARKLLRFSVPLVSLALIGFNPEIIRWGDSMRAYGPGILMIIMACGLLWHAVQSPTPRRVALAALGAVLAVQTLYHNAFLVSAICAACIIVAARRGLWRRALIVAGIGLTAGLTLLPYWGTVSRRYQWNMVLQTPLINEKIWLKLSAMLGAAGGFMVAVWVALAAAAIAAACIAQSRRLSPSLSDYQRDLSLFAGSALVLGIVFYTVFLKFLSYNTLSWYYLALVGFSALTIDAALSVFMGTPLMKAARMVIIVLVAVFSFQSSWRAVQVRQTNIDMIAAQLQEKAAKDDLILINSWEMGITFDRYYRGGTPWLTIPPLDSHKLHRYDIVKALMSEREPIKPVIEAMERTLRAGRRVWIVGGLPLFPPGQAPPRTLPPPPLPDTGWHAAPYQASWRGQAGYFLQHHATAARVERFGELVNQYERPVLEVAWGWR